MSYTCDSKLSFHECELAILREVIDKAENIKGHEIANSPQIKDMISIVEHFIEDNKLLCYGGTAINNILPKKDQFYDLSKEIPDYDFFSPNPLEDAKKLADIYYKKGYTEVEAKAGVHYGTYKVFVDFTPIADITLIDKLLYKTLLKTSIKINGIYYIPPDMLRMSMYLELSRPAGDMSRWEKVLKRLTLLNKHYPLKSTTCDYHFFSRNMENKNIDTELVFKITRDYLVNNECVFFGGYANSIFSHYMNKKTEKIIKETPDFDVLSNDPKRTANGIKVMLKNNNINNVVIMEHKNLDEIIPVHYQIKIGKDTIAFIYKTIACYNYNKVNVDGTLLRIATIDTMLSLYLAFVFANRNYYDTERIMCMAHFLFKIQQKNRLKQKGPLKRFSIKCYGEQSSLQSIRLTKKQKYDELSKNKNSKEFEQWFLNYKPNGNTKKQKKRSKKTRRNKDNRSVKTIKASINKLLTPLIN